MLSFKHSIFCELFDHLDDVLAWVKDRRGRYLWVNRAFLLTYALEHPGDHEKSSGQHVLGKTDYDLSPAFLADQFRIDDEQVLAGKKISHRIEQVGNGEEATGWNVTNKVPVFDAKGKIIGTAGTTRPYRHPEGLTGTSIAFGAVLAYMRDHYCEPITNHQLATVSRMSLRAFEREFLSEFHLTPQRYLRKLRLRMASRALIYSRVSLAELALQCGFGDQSHFTRVFRQHFGRTPREYREHYKSAPAAFRTNSAASVQ
jgi:AraC-like DNA-binding protein